MSNVPETYLYEVRPVGRPIVLDHGVEISHSKSVYLTKEDVEKCLKAAYVFRRFGSVEPQRVTTANIDRMHRANFISEVEWNKLAGDEAVVEEVKTEIVEEVEPEPVEEVVNDAVTEDAKANDKAEELTPLEEEIHLEDASEVEDSAEVEIGESNEESDDNVTVNDFFGEIVVVEDGSESLDDAEIGVEDETGVSENSAPQQSQPKQGNYVYKKHNKKNKH